MTDITAGPFTNTDQQDALRIEALRQAVSVAIHFDEPGVSVIAERFYAFLTGQKTVESPAGGEATAALNAYVKASRDQTEALLAALAFYQSREATR